MRLKNKKTGEIVEAVIVDHGAEWEIRNVYANENTQTYGSLAELNAEWKDVPEEPKEWWYIDIHGPHKVTDNDEYYQQVKAASKEIGNYFETEEEAEKAVRKLKAWHKLMDYWETEVLGWEIKDMPTGGNWQTVNVKFNVKTRKEPMELLDILFGGEV